MTFQFYGYIYDVKSEKLIEVPEATTAGKRVRAGTTLEPVEQARQSYAEELRYIARVRSSAVVNAFATVPREQFVGPGPWRINSPMDLAEYWTTDNDSASHVYHDVLIALDESRGINNGQPSLWAYLFDRLDLAPGEEVLHLGCGTGYYTAIIAELVGSAGRVTAVEIDATLAQKARAALADWPQVEVIQGDGAGTSFEPADAIIASAGATHPLPSWLDGLRPEGRLLFPMTTSRNGFWRDAVGEPSPRAWICGALCMPCGVHRFSRRA
jgi:protein-L-isoaspartate(D-aspartate) O-methyltransferase